MGPLLLISGCSLLETIGERIVYSGMDSKQFQVFRRFFSTMEILPRYTTINYVPLVPNITILCEFPKSAPHTSVERAACYMQYRQTIQSQRPAHPTDQDHAWLFNWKQMILFYGVSWAQKISPYILGKQSKVLSFQIPYYEFVAD